MERQAVSSGGRQRRTDLHNPLRPLSQPVRDKRNIREGNCDGLQIGYAISGWRKAGMERQKWKIIWIIFAIGIFHLELMTFTNYLWCVPLWGLPRISWICSRTFVLINKITQPFLSNAFIWNDIILNYGKIDIVTLSSSFQSYPPSLILACSLTRTVEI